MKVLIISAEVWQNGKNGGNVLSNIFSDTNFDFAQIYCNPGEPNNVICKRYYQITDKMLLQNIFFGKSVGKTILYEEYPGIKALRSNSTEEKANSLISLIKKINLPIFHACRSLLWWVGNWKNESLKTFICEYQPDIIFAPCYASHAMLAISRFAKALTGAPVISYISDDCYGLKHLRVSLIFWANRFLLRHNIRKTMKIYDLLYTMTDEQKEQCECDFGVPVKILRKSGKFLESNEKSTVNAPIRLIYAGGVYLNRWKTLLALGKAIQRINRDGTKMVLNVYTDNTLSCKPLNILNDGVSTFVRNAVSAEELKNIYSLSDIALHVESFDIKNRLAVRLSFSTKIVDCLDSGCAVMAICDSKQAGFAYLKRNDAAICIDSLKEIETVLRKIVDNPDILIDYQQRAFRLGRKHHNAETTKKGIISDFNKILCKES